MLAALAAAIVVGHSQPGWAEEPSVAGKAAPPEAIELFEKHVRPLLVNNCLECHGAQAEGDLRLDSRDGMLTGGYSGPSVTPGDAETSLLIKAVRHTDEDLKMPPEDKLADEAIRPLVEWINLGAPWPDGAVIASGAADAWKAHWAFQPLRQPPLPEVKNADWRSRRWTNSCWRNWRRPD